MTAVECNLCSEPRDPRDPRCEHCDNGCDLPHCRRCLAGKDGEGVGPKTARWDPKNPPTWKDGKQCQ